MVLSLFTWIAKMLNIYFQNCETDENVTDDHSLRIKFCNDSVNYNVPKFSNTSVSWKFGRVSSNLQPDGAQRKQTVQIASWINIHAYITWLCIGWLGLNWFKIWGIAYSKGKLRIIIFPSHNRLSCVIALIYVGIFRTTRMLLDIFNELR